MVWSKSVRSVVLLIGAAVTVAACDERLSGGLACPALCPNPVGTMRDTVFFALEMDSSIAGFPAFGNETRFAIETHGDTMETAAAVRFDSLPRVWRLTPTSDDSTIQFVDTGAYVQLAIETGDTLAQPTTIELYNIDLDGAEEADPTLVSTAFTPDRLLGSRTVPADSLRDSVRVPISPAFVLLKILDTFPANRLRIGIRVTQAGNPRLSMFSTNGGGAAKLVFRPTADTAVDALINEPFSRTPSEPFLASDLADYLVVIRALPDPAADVFRVGGLPARRTYLRFNIPATILDSTNIVRATLFLTQRPAFAPEPTDTLGVGLFGVVAGSTVTDLTRALFFVQQLGGVDTVKVVAADSGVRAFEMIDWVRAWRGTKPEKTPRAVGLVMAGEGEHSRSAEFFSNEAIDAVRPRLRLTYMPRTNSLP
jgi:hypothetical protein